MTIPLPNIISAPNPAIRVKGDRLLSINKKVLYALGNPQHIQFWWGKVEKVLLIGSVPEQTPQSIRVNERYYKSKSGMRIQNARFIKTILNAADWRKDAVYTVIGEYIPDLEMVMFKLSDIVGLEADFDE